jgi:hypothetical protein
MVSKEWGDWLLVTPVYPSQRGHDEYPGAADVTMNVKAPLPDEGG